MVMYLRAVKYLLLVVILADDIKDVWKHSLIFSDFRNKNKIKGNCGRCEHLPYCGGCRANAYIKYGDYLEGDDLCWKS